MRQIKRDTLYFAIHPNMATEAIKKLVAWYDEKEKKT